MSCSPFDLRDYFFGELSPAERSATETHLTACLLCRDELAKFSDLKAVLLSAAPEEEPPRRIAFVSDKVFEPRWWQKLLVFGPKLGFASAVMLSAAILFHSLHTPSVIQAPVPVARIDQQAIEAEIAKRVQVAVASAV